jgi:hypothetical protein
MEETAASWSAAASRQAQVDLPRLTAVLVLGEGGSANYLLGVKSGSNRVSWKYILS